MRRAARVDANHAAVVAALRACGCLVEDTSRLGGGFPDLLVAHRGHWYAVEIKDGRKPPSARKLTPDEAAFRARCNLHCAPYVLVESLDDVRRFVQGA